MTLQHWYDGSLVSGVRLEPETDGYSARAEMGEAETVRVVIDDEDASLNFVGYKQWIIKETACQAAVQVVWRGYVGDQRITRAPDDVSGTARRWELDLIEDNGRLRRKVLHTSSANRPSETIDARIAWLLAEPSIQNTAQAFADDGLVESSTIVLDAQDYRGRFPADVLSDCALASGFNFHFRWNGTQSENELIFQDTETSDADQASLTISNDPGEIDYATVWPPYGDPVLTRSPARIASGIWLPYSGGSVYSTESTTVSAYGAVEQVAPTASVKSASAASALATRLLASHADQDEHLECSLVLPAANLNDVRHGQYISHVYLEHLPGISGRPMRVVTKSFSRPANLSQDHYLVKLRMTPGPFDAIVQSMSWSTGAAGGSKTFGAAPTAGNLLVFAIATRDGGPDEMDHALAGLHINNINGRSISVTAFGAPTYAQTAGGSGSDTASISYVTAVGDEQTVYFGQANAWITAYELTGVTASNAETKALSVQPASASKSLGAWSVPGVIQIARFLIDTSDGSSSVAVAGDGWSIDHQGRSTYWNGVWHPHTPSLHSAVGTPAVTSDTSYPWGAIGVALRAS